ncbi:MAG: MarR family transcriptional regulator [Candidimonas sp.]|jgi:DNA-binding MarR family transcriptional regulator
MSQDSPPFLLMQQLGRTYRAMQAAFYAHIGHSASRWRILLSLHQEGDLSQKSLAARLGIDPAALTRLIKSIEQLGWVRRERDAQDNRLTIVTLTPEGLRVVNEALPRRAAFIENTVGSISPGQMEQLGSLLRELESRLTDASDAARAEAPETKNAERLRDE